MRQKIEQTLAREHKEELLASGLSTDTVAASGIYSEYHIGRIANILQWVPPGSFIPAMVFPFFDVAGNATGFRRVKPSRPRTNAEGKPVKYEQPRGVAARAYIPNLPSIHDAIRSNGQIFITEGEKKSLAMTQHVAPTIGLCGVWNWQAKRIDGKDRELIDDLLAIEWAGRQVTVVFDSDSEIKPSVELAQIELCRVLERHGASCRVKTFDALRDYGKGIDDILAIESLREEVKEILLGDGSRDLTDLASIKHRSLSKAGVYFVGSGTGSGKSSTDRVLLEGAKSSVTCLPGHAECKEAIHRYNIEWGIEAHAYPELNTSTCRDFKLAKRAMSYGLSPALTVCVSCQFREVCDFRRLVAEAEASNHKIVTHARLQTTGGSCLNDAHVVICHENVLDCMRPTIKIIRDNQDRAIEACLIAEEAMVRAERAAEKITGSSKQVRAWFAAAERTARWIRESLLGDNSIQKPAGMDMPMGVMAKIYHAIDAIVDERAAGEVILAPDEQVDADGNPLSEEAIEKIRQRKRLSFLQYLANVVHVSTGVACGHFEKCFPLDGPRRVIAERIVPLDKKQTVWLQDATTDQFSVRGLIADSEGFEFCAVGSIPQEQKHTIYQLLLDNGSPRAIEGSRKGRAGITKGRSDGPIAEFAGALAGSLLPSWLPVGIICHESQEGAIRDAVVARIGESGLAKIDHFHGKQVRGSNAWINPKDGSQRCRSLLVLGTPRMPSQRVTNRAAHYQDSDPDRYKEMAFTTRYWMGRDQDGQIVTASYLGYSDRFVDLAYRELVIAELKQAIGRARVCDPNGMPVIFAGNEPLSDWDFHSGDSFEFPAISVPGAGILLSYPELMREGLRISKPDLESIGATERQARRVVQLVNECLATPGVNLAWLRDSIVRLPWRQ